jgi:hypothetical protein
VSDSKKRITSEEMAAVIADALIDAGLIRRDDLESAIAIITEEIDARKALGDY